MHLKLADWETKPQQEYGRNVFMWSREKVSCFAYSPTFYEDYEKLFFFFFFKCVTGWWNLLYTETTSSFGVHR